MQRLRRGRGRRRRSRGKVGWREGRRVGERERKRGRKKRGSVSSGVKSDTLDQEKNIIKNNKTGEG